MSTGAFTWLLAKSIFFARAKLTYSQVPNKRPPTYYFLDFSSPLALLGPLSHLLMLRKLTFFTNSTFHFPSLLVLFTPNFHVRIACFCIYFSFMLYDSLFVLFPSLYNHVNSLLKFRPTEYFDPPSINFRNFF